MLISSRPQASGDARERFATPLGPEGWALAGILVLAVVVRLVTLGSQSYWFDEAQAAHEFQGSLGSVLHSLYTRETNPPLYFVLGWLWAKVFGTGEVALRSLSALAGVAAVALIYKCGEELVSRRAGLVAAGLAAINPFMIWYSQEAREYMLVAALSAASLLWFARALRTGEARSLAWWAGFSALALLTHFFAAFLVWPEAVWLLYAHRRRLTLAACGTLVVVQAALLPLAFTHATNSLLGFIRITPLGTRLQQVPVAFGLAQLYQSSLVNYGLLAAGVLAAALVALLVAGGSQAELRGAAVAAALAVCAIALPLLAALVGHDFLIPRALTPAWVPLAVVIGAACTASHARLAGAACAVALAALFVYGQVRIQSSHAYQRPDWRGVAHALGTGVRTERVIVLGDSLGTDPIAFYLPGVLWRTPVSPQLVSEIDVVGNSYQGMAGLLPPGVRPIARHTVDGFLVLRFALAAPVRLGPQSAVALAQRLLRPPAVPEGVLFQR